MALIENIQREDLNPIEEAVALQRLQQEFELTQQEVADGGRQIPLHGGQPAAVDVSAGGRKRRLVEHGDLEMGHAKALLALEGMDQSQAARNRWWARGLSVRQTEALVRRLLTEKRAPGGSSQTPRSQHPPPAGRSRPSVWAPEGADPALRQGQGQAGAGL